MIALLRGRVASVGEDHLVLDVQGVGYLVQAGARTLRAVAGPGATVELAIETQVREDAILLYGFLDPVERTWFKLLQTVQGVGAKVALALTGTLGPDQLAQAIAARDKAVLARAPGVGPRLAARLVAELAERFAELPRAASARLEALPAGSPDDDALAALTRLGFGRAEVLAALGRIRTRLGEGAPLEALVREGLKELASP